MEKEKMEISSQEEEEQVQEEVISEKVSHSVDGENRLAKITPTNERKEKDSLALSVSGVEQKMCDKSDDNNMTVRLNSSSRLVNNDDPDSSAPLVTSEDLYPYVVMLSGRKAFGCKICNKSFTKYGRLNIHLLQTHFGQMPYLCVYCNRKFHDNRSLNNHVRTHTGERPYSCNICNKTFTLTTHLELHVRTHTGEKPYLCNHCDKSFTNSSNLKRHVRTHTNERPYKCDQCNKTFRESCHLNKHIRLHTGEKPYSCNVCNKAFDLPNELNRHMSTHW